MNCLILLLLLCCCGNNSGCCGCMERRERNDDCGCRENRDRDKDCGCRSERSESRMDSRPFISFSSQGTCGCEGSQSND